VASVFDPLLDLSRKPITQEDFSYIVEILHKSETDSSVAILGGALTESALTQAVLSRLRESKSGHRELFRNSAPLSSFSAVTQMGFALNIFGSEYRHDLDGIRHIRNAFAHAPRELTFKNKAVSDVCDSFNALKVTEKFNETPVTARDKFSFTIRTVSMFLILASEMPSRPDRPDLP